MNEGGRVLAIGAHPDDLELGCGATLAKLAARGVHVRAIILTAGRSGTTQTYDRAFETRNALNTLGVRDIWQGEYPDTRLPEVIGDIVTTIEEHCKDLEPHRVYTMFEHDRHQDHRATYEASIIACRRIPQILSYETPSSWPSYTPVVFEQVGRYVERKIEALRHHISQRHRMYMQEQQIRCNAQFRGHQIGSGPCEGFIPYKLIL